MRALIFFTLMLLAFVAVPLRAAETFFEFTLAKDAVTSAGVYTPDGKLVRILWTGKNLTAGKQAAAWDGLDDDGRNVPPGAYQVKVVSSNAVYTSIGVLGNNGKGMPMQAATHDVVVDRATGDIYTANVWEEGGQDYKRIDKDGNHLMNAKFRARNGVGGAPCGMPIAVTEDGEFLYTTIYTLNDDTDGRKLNGGSIIRKFRCDNGNPEKFTEVGAFIRVYFSDPNWATPWGHETLHSLALSGQTLLATDLTGNRVLKYDKMTGKQTGEFPVKEPICIIVDGQNRLWVAHEKTKVTVFDLDGKVLAEPAVKAKDIICIRFGIKDELWLADKELGQLQVYTIGMQNKLTMARTIGHAAKAGQFEPLGFSKIMGFDVMPDGGFVIAHSPIHGCVLARYDAKNALLWQQVGLEFCTNGTYDQQQPDLFISSHLHAYKLQDPATGQWAYQGNIITNDTFTTMQSTGTPRIVTLNGKRFYYMLNGDIVKIFRMDGNAAVPVALVGLTPRSWDAKLMGSDLTAQEKSAYCRFTWVDTNGDGAVQAEEIVKDTELTRRMYTFSCEIEADGSLLIPNNSNRSIYRLPVTFDAKGLPRYDWTQLKEIIPADQSLRKLRPMKAVPLPDGGMYVLQTSEQSYYAPMSNETGYGKPHEVIWMGGWVMSRYAADGARLWTVPLPKHCTGMDWIPNVGRTQCQGIVVGYLDGKELYHYSPDGLLLGTFGPKHPTGWLDHNGCVSINRNPQDGQLDVFAEESLYNRISWYRMDDRSVATQTIAVTKTQVDGQTYASEADFYALLKAAQDAQQAKQFAEAATQLEKAVAIATPREKPQALQLLAQALNRVPERREEAVKQYLAAADLVSDIGLKVDMILQAARMQTTLKQYDAALATLKGALNLQLPDRRAYKAQILMEMAATYTAAGQPAEAVKQAQQAKQLLKANRADMGLLFRSIQIVADSLRRDGKVDEAVKEYQEALQLNGLNDSDRMGLNNRIADIYIANKDLAKAVEVLIAATDKNYKAYRDELGWGYLRIADCSLQLNDKERAKLYYQKILDMPNPHPDYKRTAEQKLAELKGQ